MFDPDSHVPSAEELELILTGEGFNYKLGSVELDVAKICIFTIWVGENEEQLAILSSVPLDRVRIIAAVLRATKVFGAGLNHRHEYLKDGGNIALQLNISCGMGLMERVGDSKGKATFRITQAGRDYVEGDLLTKRDAREFFDDLDRRFGAKGEWRKRLGIPDDEQTADG
jgi:hypothetical protein